MAITADKTVTTTSTAFATAGDVTVSTDKGAGGAIRWAIGEGAAPTTKGHPLTVGSTVSMTLTGTERLYMWTTSDEAVATVTASAPV